MYSTLNPVHMEDMASAGGSASAFASSSASASSSSAPACAACKYQRRRCTAECQLAAYFPQDRPRLFRNAHRLFGVSKILKTLARIGPEHHRAAMDAIVYEAEAWESHPGEGCAAIIRDLNNSIRQTELRIQQVKEGIEAYQRQQQQQKEEQQQQQQQQKMMTTTTTMIPDQQQDDSSLLTAMQPPPEPEPSYPYDDDDISSYFLDDNLLDNINIDHDMQMHAPP